jgi:hypothetical protein
MCNIRINPEATQTAINRAFEKAIVQGGNYELFFHDCEIPFVSVRNQESGASYNVTPCDVFEEFITCDCPDYKYSKFCKHCALVVEEMQIREQEEVYGAIDGNVPEYKF